MKKKHKVLFIDDDVTFSKVMRKELSRMGYSVVCAGKGETAIEKFASWEIVSQYLLTLGLLRLQTKTLHQKLRRVLFVRIYISGLILLIYLYHR